MTVQKEIKYHPDVINYFQELPFYNTLKNQKLNK